MRELAHVGGLRGSQPISNSTAGGPMPPSLPFLILLQSFLPWMFFLIRSACLLPLVRASLLGPKAVWSHEITVCISFLLLLYIFHKRSGLKLHKCILGSSGGQMSERAGRAAFLLGAAGESPSLALSSLQRLSALIGLWLHITPTSLLSSHLLL